MAAPKITVNKQTREVTMHLETTAITVPFTTFRQMFLNGGNQALVELGIKPNLDHDWDQLSAI